MNSYKLNCDYYFHKQVFVVFKDFWIYFFFSKGNENRLITSLSIQGFIAEIIVFLNILEFFNIFLIWYDTQTPLGSILIWI